MTQLPREISSMRTTIDTMQNNIPSDFTLPSQASQPSFTSNNNQFSNQAPSSVQTQQYPYTSQQQQPYNMYRSGNAYNGYNGNGQSLGDGIISSNRWGNANANVNGNGNRNIVGVSNGASNGYYNQFTQPSTNTAPSTYPTNNQYNSNNNAIPSSAQASQPVSTAAPNAHQTPVQIAESYGVTYQHYDVSTSVRNAPKPSTSCGAQDVYCQFYKSCYPCYSSMMKAQCHACINLKDCTDLTCQIKESCNVCHSNKDSSIQPALCGFMTDKEMCTASASNSNGPSLPSLP